MDLTKEKKNLMGMATIVLIITALFLGAKFVNEVKSSRYIGGGTTATNTIAISGTGDVMAVPDISTITFSVESTKDTQLAASTDMNTKVKAVLDFLKTKNIEEKDIKTESSTSYPKYSNPQYCSGYGAPCRTEDAKITGYTTSQSISVKIRKVDDASAVYDGINKIGVTNLYGPEFTIDDPDALQAEARSKAIADAKEKADELAKQLGVHIVRIVNFSENGNGGYYPTPMYSKAEAADASGAPANLPKGENKITSNVTITYEIK